jgi:NADPH2:quinone reductase
LGADRVIDTSTTGITAALGPDAYDVCLDHLGGVLLADLMSAAAPRARIVQIGRLAGGYAQLDLELLAARRVSLIGTTFRGREAGELHALVAHLRTALPGLPREHNVRTVIDSVFDLTAADHAAERLNRSGLTGKVILRITRR